MFCVSFLAVFAFGLLVSSATARFSRDEVVAYTTKFSAVISEHLIANPKLADSLLFTPDCIQQFYMFGQWQVGTFDQVVRPFAEMGKEMALVNKANTIGDNVMVVDFTVAQTTKTGCRWATTGSAVLELTRSADGDIRTAKHTVYIDNENSESLMKCMQEMNEKKKDL